MMYHRGSHRTHNSNKTNHCQSVFWCWSTPPSVVLLLPGLTGRGTDCPTRALPAYSVGGCNIVVAVVGRSRPHGFRVLGHFRVPFLFLLPSPRRFDPACCTLRAALGCTVEAAPACNVALVEVGEAVGMLVALVAAGTLEACRIVAVAHTLLAEVSWVSHSSGSAPPPATP